MTQELGLLELILGASCAGAGGDAHTGTGLAVIVVFDRAARDADAAC